LLCFERVVSVHVVNIVQLRERCNAVVVVTWRRQRTVCGVTFFSCILHTRPTSATCAALRWPAEPSCGRTDRRLTAPRCSTSVYRV